MANIVSWRELKVWQKAHELTIYTYKITATFPNQEKFGLTSQMQRAAVSVASNIVEGFRRRTLKDSLSFYNTSDGSLEELRYQYLLSCDLGYINKAQLQIAEGLAQDVSRLLHAWSKSQRENAHHRSS